MEINRLKISKKVLETLEILAKRRKTTIEKVLADAISTELYMDNKLREGFTILVQDPDTQQSWRIIFTHMSEPDQMHY